MSNLEHYFENLLFEGRDVQGDWNKNALTETEQEAVRICADYVLYTIFLNREDFLKFIHKDFVPSADVTEVRHGEWLPDVYAKDLKTGYEYTVFKCSECGHGCVSRNNFCHNCGADMRRHMNDSVI